MFIYIAVRAQDPDNRRRRYESPEDDTSMKVCISEVEDELDPHSVDEICLRRFDRRW